MHTSCVLGTERSRDCDLHVFVRLMLKRLISNDVIRRHLLIYTAFGL